MIALAYILAVAASICYYTGADAYAEWLIDYVEPGYYLLVGLGLGLFYVITAAKILFTMKRLHLRESSSQSVHASQAADGSSKQAWQEYEKKAQKMGSRIRSVRTLLLL